MRLAGVSVGAREPLFLIAGPCVIESESLVLSTAERLKDITVKLGVPLVFKASFDKANRSSGGSFRGLGIEQGLKVLERVRRELALPVLTDVHESSPLDEVAAVVPWCRGDVLLVDNMLIAHARNSFAGERKILVAMGDMVSLDELSWSLRGGE